MRKLLSFLLPMLGARNSYRLGRAVYMWARGDIQNNMKENGEIALQSSMLSAWEKTATNAGLLQTADDRNLVVFDVGANVGDWSLSLLEELGRKKFFNYKLYAFEPVPATFDKLKENLEKYSQPEVSLNDIAMSSSTGFSEIFLVDELYGGTNSLYNIPNATNRKVVSVRTDTVFNYCRENNIEHIHILKCDTEGHDIEVIRGALPMLEKGQISIFQFEYNYRWIYSRNFLRDVFLLVDGLPYKVAKLQSNNLLVFEEWHYELDRFFEGNYALIHNDCLNWLQVRYVKFDVSNAMTAIN